MKQRSNVRDFDQNVTAKQQIAENEQRRANSGFLYYSAPPVGASTTSDRFALGGSSTA
jgi:hypothetical protein